MDNFQSNPSNQDGQTSSEASTFENQSNNLMYRFKKAFTPAFILVGILVAAVLTVGGSFYFKNTPVKQVNNSSENFKSNPPDNLMVIWKEKIDNSLTEVKVIDGNVYLSTLTRIPTIRQLDGATGKVINNFEFENYSAPLLIKDRVGIFSNRLLEQEGFIAIDLDTKQKLWNFSMINKSSYANNFSDLKENNNTLVFSSHNSKDFLDKQKEISLMDFSNGTVIKKISIVCPNVEDSGIISFDSSGLLYYCNSKNENSSSSENLFRGVLIMVDPNTLEQKWKYEVDHGDAIWHPLANNQIIYLSGTKKSSETQTFGIDKNTGKVKWIFPVPKLHHNLALGKEYACILSDDNIIIINAFSGNQQSKIPIQTSSLMNLICSDKNGAVSRTDYKSEKYDDVVEGFSLEKGKINWQVKRSGKMPSGFVPTPDVADLISIDNGFTYLKIEDEGQKYIYAIKN